MNYATLGAICDQSGGSVQTGPFGSQLHQSDYKSDGVPVVMPQDIIDGRISEIRIARIDESLAKKLSRHLLNEEDIVFPRRGEINKRAIIETNQAGYFCGTGCLKISIPPKEILPRWLYYYLGQEQVVRWIESKAIGATMLNLNTGILRSLPLEYSSLDDQHRIVGYLSAYDDLIAINQRRIQLLEKAARCLYREWFVHLRFPGYESVPVKDGVPKGWMRLILNDVCDAVGGGTPSTDHPEYWGGDVVWITPTDVTRNDCLVMLDSVKKITEAGLSNSSAKLVPAETILMTSRASIGFFALMDRPVCTNQGFISVIPRYEKTRMFLLFNLLNRVEEMISLATGATFKELTKKTFRSLPVIWPTSVVLKDFETRVYPLIQQTRFIKKQSENLKRARDLLLPKLMSGQIDVSRIPLPEEEYELLRTLTPSPPASGREN